MSCATLALSSDVRIQLTPELTPRIIRELKVLSYNSTLLANLLAEVSQKLIDRRVMANHEAGDKAKDRVVNLSILNNLEVVESLSGMTV
jgi:hypothetical protein